MAEREVVGWESPWSTNSSRPVRHRRELPLDCLELGDGASELFTVQRIGRRRIQSASADAPCHARREQGTLGLKNFGIPVGPKGFDRIFWV